MKKFSFSILLLMPIFISSFPSVVAILRHGEKQVLLDSDGNPVYKNGVIQYTEKLSDRGWQRAGALAYFFSLNPDYTCFGKPAAIFAGNIDKQNQSVRPIDTITPLANNLGMKVSHQYSDPEYKKMVDFIKTSKKYDGKYIIICFEHYHIPLIANAFGVTQAPKTWDNTVFDRVWVFKFDEKGKVLSFENRPQRLMFGDSQE